MVRRPAMEGPSSTPRDDTGRVWPFALGKSAAVPSMAANEAPALHDGGCAPGHPGRRVGRVTQPEGRSHGAPMVLSEMTMGAGAA